MDYKQLLLQSHPNLINYLENYNNLVSLERIYNLYINNIVYEPITNVEEQLLVKYYELK
jgi:hypothetical protein